MQPYSHRKNAEPGEHKQYLLNQSEMLNDNKQTLYKINALN